MSKVKGSNPMLTERVFKRASPQGKTMTIGGTINKLTVLLFLFILTAGASWYYYPLFDMSAVLLLTLVAFILGIVTSFIPRTSPYTTPIYVLIEGLVIGHLSFLYDAAYNGIVLQAALLTIGVFALMIAVYKFRIIKVDDRFVKGIFVATGSIALVYLINLVLMCFGIQMPFLHDNGWAGILISLVIVGVAAFNFLADFYFIEMAEQRKAPKFMEWYLSFGVFLTIVWLYLEILKLLAKLRSRD